jgi:hypothetical protein
MITEGAGHFSLILQDIDERKIMNIIVGKKLTFDRQVDQL